MTHEEFRHELELSKEKGQRMLFEKYCGYVYTIVHSRLRSCASRELSERFLRLDEDKMNEMFERSRKKYLNGTKNGNSDSSADYAEVKIRTFII